MESQQQVAKSLAVDSPVREAYECVLMLDIRLRSGSMILHTTHLALASTLLNSLSDNGLRIRKNKNLHLLNPFLCFCSIYFKDVIQYIKI